jgi:hypothetical protein
MAYPVSITLTSRLTSGVVTPRDHLQETGNALAQCLDGFELHFCRQECIGTYPAARSQHSFQSNFQLYHLNFAWCIDSELLTATLTAPEMGVKKGWKDLRGFVESVGLEKGAKHPEKKGAHTS